MKTLSPALNIAVEGGRGQKGSTSEIETNF